MLGLIKGYDVMRLGSMQVDIFKFRCLLDSYVKVSFELHNHAGVGTIVGIGAEKVSSWCVDNHDLVITLELIQGRSNMTCDKAERFK